MGSRLRPPASVVQVFWLALLFARNTPAANCTPAPIGSVMQFACPFLAPSLRSFAQQGARQPLSGLSCPLHACYLARGVSGLAFHTQPPGGKLHASPYRVCHAFCMPFSCSLPSLLASPPLVGPVRTIVRGSGRRQMLSQQSAPLTSGPTRGSPRRRSVVRSARGTPAPVGSVMPLAGLLPCPGGCV